jgi:hypothetical protein
VGQLQGNDSVVSCVFTEDDALNTQLMVSYNLPDAKYDMRLDLATVCSP